MADEIVSTGIKIETGDVERAVQSLDKLAAKGPKVEQSLDKVEQTSKRIGKSLATLGSGANVGLDAVGKSSSGAADQIGKLDSAAKKSQASMIASAGAAEAVAAAIANVSSSSRSAVASQESLAAAVAKFTTAEREYIQRLVEEAKQIGMTRAEREKYIAQSRSMSEGAQQIAAAVGAKIDAYKAEARELSGLTSASNEASQSMFGMVKTGVVAFLGGQVVSAARDAAKALYAASAAGERLRTMLDFSTGGNSAREIEYLRGVTERLGLQFSSTAVAYGQFAAAAKGTALEGQKARDIFESIASASAVMGLSADQTSGVLLALQQMISKGTVQAEELRGQLGERLPGAFQIAAKAMGVTTAELGKMLERGEVVASDFLPKFAKALNENLGGAAEKAAERLDASVNKVENAGERLKQNLGDTGASSFIAGQYAVLADGFGGVSESIEKARASGSGFAGQMAAGSIAVARFLNPLQAFSYSAIETGNALKQAEKEFEALQARGAATSDSFYLRNEYFQLGKYIDRLKEAQQEQSKLGGTKDPRDQSGFTGRGQSYDAEAKRLEGVQAAMQKVVSGLSGVKESFQKDLTALYAGYQSGLIKLADYQAAVAKLIDESGGGKANAKAINEANKELSGQAKLLAELSGLSTDFAEDWDTLNKLYKQGKLNVDQLAKAQAALLEKQPFMRDIAKEQAEAEKARAKAYDEVVKSYEKHVDQLQKSASSAADQVQKLQDEEKAAMLAAAGNLSLAQAIQEVTIARLREQQTKEAQAGNQEAVDSIEKEINARRELIGLIGNKESRDAAAKAAKDAADEWRKTADKIEDAITDSLMRGFESGKGFAENLRDTVENMFKTMVLRPVISAIVQPVAQQLAGSFGGANVLGAASNGMSLYNAAGAAAGLWGGSAAYGAALGTTSIGAGSQAAMLAAQTGAFGAEGAAMTAAAAGNAATGSIMSTIGAAAPYLAAALAIYSIAKSMDDSGTLHTGASSGYSAAGGLLTGQGVYGVGLSNEPYSKDTEALTTGITQSIVGILDSTASTFGKQAGYAAAAGFMDDTSKDGAWGALSIKIGDKIVEGFGQDGNGRWPGQSFSDGQAGTQEYLAAVSADVRAALEQIGLPDWASGMLDRLGDAPSLDQLAATVAQINATQAALVSMGEVMPQLSGLTESAVNSLLASFGSVDQLSASAQSYYENFYSQAERSARTTEQVGEALDKLGLSMPGTREAYRALVEAQDLTTESGQQTYAALLKLSPAFASVVAETQALTDAVDESAAAIAKAAEEMAEAGRRALASLAEDQGSLLVELLNAQGNGAEASALERQQALARITAGLSETDKAAATAAYDYNQALRDQITALLAATDAQKSAEAAAKQAADAAIAQAQARAQAIASEGYGLETRLLQAQGDTQALRDRELAALDNSNRAILEHIFALEDKKAADDAAAKSVLEASQSQQRAVEDAKRIAESIASEQYGLETRLLQAQGKTAELRRRELEALDPANRKYLEQLFALEDKTAAEQAATAAAQEAARAAEAAASAQQQAAEEAERAAERIRDAWQSVADSLYDEVARIRGLIQQDSGASYASMVARFGITTAQARSGDQEAAKLLPSLSQTMLTLAEAQATSLAELQRIRAQTAASLESTGSILASQFGLTIPKLDTGTNYVPRDMLAVIHKGEAVVPAAYNPASSGGSNAELVAEIRGLREENKVQALRLVQLSSELNRVVKAWDANGLPMERVEA